MQENRGIKLVFIGLTITTFIVISFMVTIILASKIEIFGYNMQKDWTGVTILMSYFIAVAFLLFGIKIMQGVPTSEVDVGSYIIKYRSVGLDKDHIYLILVRNNIPIYCMLSLKEYPDLEDYEVGQEIKVLPKSDKNRIKLVKQS